ncbi:proteasome inhibitor PI31 subunit [Aricia agestis]|uniref:proteasome inhibitor PI31 subunit n=1 Tax=Aricia agestis TaxID=91739 RepID=UPI001C206D0A|nr:proteasome inhibitor PI31 subunit [Aricia agestis]
MATDPLYGWELTYKSVENNVKDKSDIIIAFIHFNLLKRGFRCIGIGDELSLSGDEQKSELLPTGWNEGKNYSLRYVLDDKLFVLHGLKTDDNLIINLMRTGDLEVSSVALNMNELVQDTRGSIENLIPTFKDFMYKIKRDLIESLTEKTTNTTETQTTRGTERRSSNPPPGPRLPQENPHPLWVPGSGRNVGRADLDPLGVGGGMLFDPFQPRRDLENPGLGIPGGLPRGAVPPGARFDPFGPPGAGPFPGRRPPPDADHFPPPGFNDNQFL